MKEFNDHLMKFKITNDKLKMEISLKDLAWLFHNSPENVSEDGDTPSAKIMPGRRQEFAERLVKILMDDAEYERDCFKWSEPFENAFLEMIENAEELLKYNEDDY
jgi:hypothetical protein